MQIIYKAAVVQNPDMNIYEAGARAPHLHSREYGYFFLHEIRAIKYVRDTQEIKIAPDKYGTNSKSKDLKNTPIVV
jgi:hypothetical protein